MKRMFSIFLLVVIVGAGYAVKDYVIPQTWRYKITIEIETPEGIKSGSAVREVRARKNAARFLNPDVNPIEYSVIGEAVVIDLEEKGVLFSLLDWDSNSILENNFPINSEAPEGALGYYKKLKIGTKVVNNNWASFVFLTNKDNSENMYRLDSKNFEKVFNGKITYKKTTIEITDEPVTLKMEELLSEIGGGSKKYDRQLFQNK